MSARDFRACRPTIWFRLLGKLVSCAATALCVTACAPSPDVSLPQAISPPPETRAVVSPDTKTDTPHAKHDPKQDAARPEPGPDMAWWAAEGGEGGVPPPRYDGFTRTSRYVDMPDGVRLAIDVYLPKNLAAATRLSTILEQTRYLRSFELAPGAPEAADRPARKIEDFVKRGYAYVIVDVRGTGASFGNRRAEFSQQEIRDGGVIVDWIVKQPWSDGKLVATGVSYVGTTAELLLVNRRAAVRAVAPRFSLFDAYTDIVFPGGVFHTEFVERWGRMIGLMDQNDLKTFAERLHAPILGVRPVDDDQGRKLLTEAIHDHAKNGDVYGDISPINFRDDRMLSGGKLDDLSPATHREALSASGAAIYSYSGWFDGAYPRAAIHRFRTLDNPGSRLVIGPWNHGGLFYYSPSLGMRASSFSHPMEQLRFFAGALDGTESSIAKEPRVHYYTMGTEKWNTADTWPPPETEVQVWYMAGDNVLTPNRPGDTGGSFDTYKVDLTAGTGDQSRWNTLLGGGPVNYPDRQEEDGKLLTYTSAPLERSMEITGHPVVTLHVSSTATDGQFFVYLEDVDETGSVSYITEGTLRAIHRKTSKSRAPYKAIGPHRTYRRRDAQPLVPGQVAELVFDLLPTSYVFREGRRIRVGIAGADKDHFAVIPGDPPTIQLHRSGARLSHIDLPVMPPR